MLEPQASLRTRSRALRILLVFFLVLLLLVAGAVGFYVWASGSSGPMQPVVFEIPRGATTGEVGALLKEEEVIRSSFLFGVMVRLRGLGSAIQAGTYELQSTMRLSAVLDVLERGPIPEPLPLSLTVPEGLRLEQVADRVSEELDIGRNSFIQAATSGQHELPPYLPRGTPSVEGFLFPKTYEFEEGIKAADVITRLLEQFEEEAGPLPWRRAKKLGVTRFEVVTIASMIEREARFAGDRRKISAVIHNRLEREMLLEIDATVQYALPEHKERLTFEDLEYDSPYNTYLYPGLPPGPIASPGLAALEAALRPAKVDFLYYVLVDPETGRHGFAETYEEFLQLRDQAQLGG